MIDRGCRYVSGDEFQVTALGKLQLARRQRQTATRNYRKTPSRRLMHLATEPSGRRDTCQRRTTARSGFQEADEVAGPILREPSSLHGTHSPSFATSETVLISMSQDALAHGDMFKCIAVDDVRYQR